MMTIVPSLGTLEFYLKISTLCTITTNLSPLYGGRSVNGLASKYIGDRET
jgi:hypothetical protein